jgi:hypothetical protein
VDISGPLFLSGTGVLLAAIAFYNRDKPAWQKDMRAIYVLAIGQVVLGTALFVLGRM